VHPVQFGAIGTARCDEDDTSACIARSVISRDEATLYSGRHKNSKIPAAGSCVAQATIILDGAVISLNIDAARAARTCSNITAAKIVANVAVEGHPDACSRGIAARGSHVISHASIASCAARRAERDSDAPSSHNSGRVLIANVVRNIAAIPSTNSNSRARVIPSPVSMTAITDGRAGLSHADSNTGGAVVVRARVCGKSATFERLDSDARSSRCLAVVLHATVACDARMDPGRDPVCVTAADGVILIARIAGDDAVPICINSNAVAGSAAAIEPAGVVENRAALPGRDAVASQIVAHVRGARVVNEQAEGIGINSISRGRHGGRRNIETADAIAGRASRAGKDSRVSGIIGALRDVSRGDAVLDDRVVADSDAGEGALLDGQIVKIGFVTKLDAV